MANMIPDDGFILKDTQATLDSIAQTADEHGNLLTRRDDALIKAEATTYTGVVPLTGPITMFEDRRKTPRLATVYPAYYKPVGDATHLDAYAVMRMFNVTDQNVGHALKKLLLTGQRTGGKDFRKDVTEARDTLDRLLELMDQGEPA